MNRNHHSDIQSKRRVQSSMHHTLLANNVYEGAYTVFIVYKEKYETPTERPPKPSCARTNFKVEGASVLRKTGVGHRKNFLVMPLHFVGSRSTISRFGERFRDGQYSLVSFFFDVLILTVPPSAQPFVEVGARSPVHVPPHVPHGVGATELDTLDMSYVSCRVET